MVILACEAGTQASSYVGMLPIPNVSSDVYMFMNFRFEVRSSIYALVKRFRIGW